MTPLRRWHRALAWVAAFVAVAWAGSGALHPLIVAIGPKPVAFQPPRDAFTAVEVRAPAALLAATGIAEARALRYVAVDGRPVLQVQPADAGERRYVDAVSGTVLADADRQRAIALARHYSGMASTAVRDAWLVERFDRDYPPINRLLPVWAVAFAGREGVIAFVDTGSDRLGTLNGASKRFWQGLFQTLHTLSFITVPYLRPAAVGLLVGVLLATTVFGASLLLRLGGGRRSRQWHRRLAWVAVLPALLWPATGLFKLVGDPFSPPAAPPPPMLVTAALTAAPFASGDGALLDAVAVPVPGGAPLWRIAAVADDPETAVRIRLRDSNGQPLAGDDAALARQIAAGTFGQAVDAPITELRRFDRDYGFANKRLPVWKVAGPDGRDWYFETRSGLVAARIGGLSKLQAQVFDLLHKGQLFNRLGLSLGQRDLLLGTLALLIVLTAGVGLAIRLQRRSERDNPARPD